jgi:putative addiction module killer protein
MPDATPRILRLFQTEEGTEPFREWITRLRDAEGRAVIRTRLNRVQTGNLANCRSVGGGVHELKVNFGPGYRVYFGVDGNLVVLLNGGDKASQSRDITKAKAYWTDYNA